MNIEQERAEIIKRLELINIASPGRDKLLRRLRDLDLLNTSNLRHPADRQRDLKYKII